MACTFRTLVTVAAVAGLTTTLAACGNSGDNQSGGPSPDGQVEIEFFQSKSEAVSTYDEIIALFEAANPGIKVSQTTSPDPETVIQSRLTSGDVPDVAALSPGNYATMVAAGSFEDLSGSAAAAEVTNETALNGLRALGLTEQDFGLPMSVNSLLVLYNKDLWNELGLSEPKTWSEFIDVAEQVVQADKAPFYFTILDAWTAQGIGNGISASELPVDFVDGLRSGNASFEQSSEVRTVAEKIVELSGFAQPDAAGRGYDDGNIAFANGESVMYIQGNWAMAPILGVNPDINLGAFVLPGTDDAERNRVVSGPDQYLAILKGSEHPEEAETFIEFLLSMEAQKLYGDQQALFSVRTDVAPANDVVKPIYDEWISQGRVFLPLDSFFSGSSDYAAINQQLFTTGDVDQYVAAMQQNWDAFGIK